MTDDIIVYYHVPNSLSTLHLRPKVAGDGRLTWMRLWGVWNLVDGLHDMI